MIESARIKVWSSMSELYLDTDLSQEQLTDIIQTFSDSGYDYNELRRIERYELLPVLCNNQGLLIDGVWIGFDDKWLIENCEINYKKRHLLTHKIKCWYLFLTSFYMRIDYWFKIRRELK
jgi:hypothetical protein